MKHDTPRIGKQLVASTFRRGLLDETGFGCRDHSNGPGIGRKAVLLRARSETEALNARSDRASGNTGAYGNSQRWKNTPDPMIYLYTRAFPPTRTKDTVGCDRPFQRVPTFSGPQIGEIGRH